MLRPIQIPHGEVDFGHAHPWCHDIGVELGGSTQLLERRIGVAQAQHDFSQLDAQESALG